MKVRIKDVCLISVDCVNYAKTIHSLRNCMSRCEFDSVVLLTDIDIEEPGIYVIKIPRINSKEAYSAFIIRELYKYFSQTHCLIVQHDGTILNADCWDESFKEFDVIGARWLYPDNEPNCGNGGFSLRSHRLMETVAKDKFIDILHPCDEILGRLYRRYLEKTYSIKFAPNDVCDRFSYELHTPVQRTFGHHAFFHLPFKEHIILKRMASCGDVIMLEPVISYYSENGYQVVLDTIQDYMQLFSRYRHKVIHISQMDSRIKPIKTLSFDMAYEINPTQSVQKSYINITNEPIPLRNSILNFYVEPNGGLFNKLILIHIDETGMPYRNANGVNWAMVVSYYTRLGYQIFQTGKRMGEQIAPIINLANIEMLMYMVSSAELVIGIDSSPTQIAVALGTPAVIFFGSVNPELRYISFGKIEVIHTDCPSVRDRFCYHEISDTVGKKCEHSETKPPCSIYNEWDVIRSANKLLKLN